MIEADRKTLVSSGLGNELFTMSLYNKPTKLKETIQLKRPKLIKDMTNNTS